MYSVLQVAMDGFVGCHDLITARFEADCRVSKTDRGFAVSVADTPTMGVHWEKLGEIMHTYCSVLRDLNRGGAVLTFDLAVYAEDYGNRVFIEVELPRPILKMLIESEVNVVCTIYGRGDDLIEEGKKRATHL